MPDKKAKAARPHCPICGKPTVQARMPFCSTRCANIDLGRWLGGEYRIPTDERPDAAPPDSKEED